MGSVLKSTGSIRPYQKAGVFNFQLIWEYWTDGGMAKGLMSSFNIQKLHHSSSEIKTFKNL